MKILVTGGAGFIGTNVVLRMAERGHEVIVLDNLSKRGSAANLACIRAKTKAQFAKVDIRRLQDIEDVVSCNPVDVVIHLAAQTAVTTSLEDPMDDFTTNALGTLNVLETVRKYAPEAVVLYSSTNKVYGDLADLKLTETETRYEAEIDGVGDDRQLDFFSPYGCSKGAADQYVRDYHRVYGLKTVVARQSCIYGEYQNGTEDQGWVAWFAKAVMEDRRITIYGNGKQVRDALHVQDLVDFYEKAISGGPFGKTYNVGGGPDKSMSLIDLLRILGKILKKEPILDYGPERVGDQKYFVSANERAFETFGWKPKIGTEEGVRRLISHMEAQE